MFRKRTQVAIAALALMVMLAGVALGQAASRAQPTAVAVVDIQQVFNSLKEKTQLEAQIRSKTTGLKQQEDEKKNNIRSLQQDLQMFAPGNPDYKDKQDEVRKAIIGYQNWSQFEKQELDREQALQVERLYKKTLDTIGRMSQQAGYDVVLFKEQKVDFSNADPKQLSTLIQVRKVLWSSDQVDLTDQLIQRMNNEYDNNSGG